MIFVLNSIDCCLNCFVQVVNDISLFKFNNFGKLASNIPIRSSVAPLFKLGNNTLNNKLTVSISNKNIVNKIDFNTSKLINDCSSSVDDKPIKYKIKYTVKPTKLQSTSPLTNKVFTKEMLVKAMLEHELKKIWK